MSEHHDPTADERASTQAPSEGPDPQAPETHPDGEDERQHPQEPAEGAPQE